MAQVEMQRALKSGVSWGMADEDATAAGEDVGDAALGPDGVLDWRSYSQTHVRPCLEALAWLHAGLQHWAGHTDLFCMH